MSGSRIKVLTIVSLTAAVILGVIVIWLRYSPVQPVEISMPQQDEWRGEIYIGGNVTAPGSYPFRAGDSLEDLLRAAGGTGGSVSLDRLRLYVAGEEDESSPQKVDINRAEAWLLKALPGIGDALAQRIVDYRRQNGPFRNTNDLLKVAGIGAATYARVKDLITVAGE